MPNMATDPCAGASRPSAIIMPEAMADGETITEEEASAPGWIDAIRRRAKSSTTTNGKPAGVRFGGRRTRAVTRVSAASRLPRSQRTTTVSSTAPEVAWMYPTPKQPSPTPPTKDLPTNTKNPTATPTWADRVTGETRGYARSGNLPQHENDEIRELKRELALLRKENEEFKALIRNMQQLSERAVETPTPAAPAVEPASTNSSNANRPAKRRVAEDPSDEPVTMSNFMEALARLHADIAADRVADMTPHTLQLTELHTRLQMLEQHATTNGLLPLSYPSPPEGSCVRVAPGSLDCWVWWGVKGELVSRSGEKRCRRIRLNSHSERRRNCGSFGE
ncbi:hypothetical protein MRX96_044698 [Rhipicephalus microplus]